MLRRVKHTGAFEMPVAAETLALQRLYHWEATAPDRVILTQPSRDAHGTLVVRDYTWRQVMDEVRRMAAHLQSLGLPKGSNCTRSSPKRTHASSSSTARPSCCSSASSMAGMR